MKTEQHRWTELREQAQTCLPADFALQVVRRAQNRKKAGRREYLLIAVTAGLCLISVAVANLYVGNQIQKRNLAQWKVAEAQIRALRTSI